MFTVGKRYDFRMIEAADEVSFTGTIEAFEYPLIKLQDAPRLKSETIETADGGLMITMVEDEGAAPYPGRIINVTSPHFISAVERQD
ncbi:MAG TPA: hypothetical protein VGN93_13240 [Shinella sp.]|jgi:hypothetical protein|uniref:hypothetical protein n=1 Tax=Shinella sp. TaxID=1870904 RepID=UPI002E12CFDD|nr:hypothetical protein [Shinella sp.]